MYLGAIKLDWDLVSTVLVRLSGSLVSLLTASMFVIFLDATEQGYWYTFNSLLVVGGFAELGAGQIILRFVAANVGGISSNATKAKIRLRNIFALSIFGGSTVALASAVFILPFGFFWMSSGINQEIYWKGPWVLAALSSIPILILGFLNSYFEGWQRVSAANFRRLFSSWIMLGVVFLVFWLGGGLMAFGLSKLVAGLAGIALAIFSNRDIITEYRLMDNSEKAFDYKSEFLPLQWRYAQTWVTGIFVNALYAPIIFKIVGADAAGKYGMTISIIGVISSVSSSWLGARQAKLAALVGSGDIRIASELLTEIVKATFTLFVISSFFLVLAISIMPSAALEYVNRILPLPDVIFGVVGALLWLMIGVYAGFVRSFGVEPFVKLAWLHAAYSVLVGIPAILLFDVRGGLIVAMVGNAGSLYVCYSKAKTFMIK